MSQMLTVHEWEQYFKDKGVNEDYISEYITYVKRLYKNKCPVIFEFEHLSKLLGIKRQELAKIVNSPESFYRTFTIPKRNGGSRQITAPYPTLLHCQKWIYKNILLSQKIHESVHGFVPGRSIITNASHHLSQDVMLKMDFENFFTTIPINWVVNYFSKLGYANNVSFYLASMCCYDGYLNQGSATSPYLTNVLLKSLDGRLHKISLAHNIIYTRYADDITFSGKYISLTFVDNIVKIIESYSLKINNKKTRLLTKPGQRIVTGLSLSNGMLTIPRQSKREIKKEMYYIEKYGLVSHISKMRIHDPYYLDSIYGKLQFWLQVEPNSNTAVKYKYVLDRIKQITD